MKLLDIGRVCMKIAGRDAGQKCVIVDILDNKYVLIDGQTRRKRCSINHLEPLQATLPVSKEASHEDVTKAFADIGITLSSKKPKKTGNKPLKKRKSTA